MSLKVKLIAADPPVAVFQIPAGFYFGLTLGGKESVMGAVGTLS